MATRTERLIVARTHHAAFVEKYPFHTSVISRMRPLVDPTIETMGVSMDQGSLLLHVNERWADAHADMFVGLLLHEVHHVVLGHLVDARLREVDAPDLMDIALECAANEHIVEPLPNPILWQHFERAGFRANQSSVERYGILRAHVEANSSSRTLPLPGPSDAHEGLRKPVDSASMALQRRIVEELVELAESRAQPDDATIAGWETFIARFFRRNPHLSSTGVAPSRSCWHALRGPCPRIGARRGGSPIAWARCQVACASISRELRRASSCASTRPRA